MKPIIYRITHLWPNKQPGHGSTTAQIEEDQERWTIYVCPDCGNIVGGRDTNPAWDQRDTGEGGCLSMAVMQEVEVVPAADRSSTVQIKPETDEPRRPDVGSNALPSRFVSLQDYERLLREKWDDPPSRRGTGPYAGHP